jgi:hypothetical protein
MLLKFERERRTFERERAAMCSLTLSNAPFYTEMKTFSLRLLTQASRAFERIFCDAFPDCATLYISCASKRKKKHRYINGERESRLSISLWHKRKIYGKFTSRCSRMYKEIKRKTAILRVVLKKWMRIALWFEYRFLVCAFYWDVCRWGARKTN